MTSFEDGAEYLIRNLRRNEYLGVYVPNKIITLDPLGKYNTQRWTVIPANSGPNRVAIQNKTTGDFLGFEQVPGRAIGVETIRDWVIVSSDNQHSYEILTPYPIDSQIYHLDIQEENAGGTIFAMVVLSAETDGTKPEGKIWVFEKV